MSVSLTVETRELQRVLSGYARSKMKTDADVVNKAMRYWVPFAAKRVIDKTPGSRKILQELLAPSKGRYKAKRSKSKYNNTAAAAIFIWRLKQKGMPIPADLNDRIDRFVGARQNSAQFLRAGFIPAYRQFGVPNRKVGTQRHFKGKSLGKKAIPSAFFKVVAFVTNAREGAHAIAPTAFQESIREVENLFIKFMNDDLNRVGRQWGLNP
jgi:hypothetical protein